MRTLASLMLLAFSTGTAMAGILGEKNPDLPNGGIALDLSVDKSVSGDYEESAWHLIDFVDTGGGLIADGLTVASDADLDTRVFGLSLMTAVDPHITIHMQYQYSRFALDNVHYQRAGALSTPDLRLDPPYDATVASHSVGVRLRFWFGTQ